MNKQWQGSLLANTLLGSAFFSCAVHAATPTFSGEIETGIEQDSNLSVTELDQHIARSDWATLFNARAQAQWQGGKGSSLNALKLKGGLGYNSKTWQDYSAYDLAIKQMFFDGSYRFKPLTVGVTYHHADAALDDSDFLQLQQRSLYASRLFKKTIFVRAAVNEQEKDFPTSNGRNANNRSLGGDVFFFFNEGKTMLTLGTTLETENAASREFDYDGLNIRTSVSHQFPIAMKNNRVQLSWRYDDRDYLGITPSIQTARHDQRQVTALEWQLDTTKWLSVIGKLERGDYDSNLASANYSETLGSVSLKARF